MYPNLCAEQARHKMTNQEISSVLGICRATYIAKKRNGKFTLPECEKLCQMFNCQFEYLFKKGDTKEIA